MVLHKPALMLFGALAASLMLSACNQNPGASTAAPDSVKSSEPATVPVTAVKQEDPSAVAAASEIPAGCRIQSSAEWKASVNAQPPGSPKLTVSGKVETSTGGYEVTVERKAIDSNPGIVSLELQVVPPPADAMVSQMITPHAVKIDVPDVSGDVKWVVINCGGEKLAEIAEISMLD